MKNIFIYKKEFEDVINDIISTRDQRLLVEKCLQDPYKYRSIVLDISKGRKSANFKLVQHLSKDNKINESFVVDEALSVISFFQLSPGRNLNEYYEILQCTKDSEPSEIREKWLKLMKQYHPDKAGDSGLEKSKLINQAYNAIVNSSQSSYLDDIYLDDVNVHVKDLNYVRFRNTRFTSVVAAGFLVLLMLYVSMLFVNRDDALEQLDKDAGVFKSERKVVLKDTSKVNRNGNFKSREQVSYSAGIDEEAIENNHKPAQSNSSKLESENGVDASSNLKMINAGDNEDRVPNTNKYDSTLVTGVMDESLIENNDSLNQENHDSGSPDINSITDENSIINNEPDNSLWRQATLPNNVNTDTITNDSGNIEEQAKSGARKNNFKSDEDERTSSGSSKDSAQVRTALKNTDQAVKVQTTTSMEIPSNRELVKPTVNDYLNESISASSFELASTQTADPNMPTKSSVYQAISDYIHAYRKRDIERLGSMFRKDAKENGIAMDEVLEKYKDNFQLLDIIAYDIKFNSVNLDDESAMVDGDFIISYKTDKDNNIKKSYGDIIWKLSWNNSAWLINDIKYNVTKTRNQ